MPIIEFDDNDINRSKIVTPGWYRVKIGLMSESISSKGDSTNWTFDGKILFNADDGSTTFADVPTPYWNFNSKAKGFMVGFFAALGGDPKSGSRFELKNAEGKEIDVFIENEIYKGSLVNRINHKYRAPRNDSSQASA